MVSLRRNRLWYYSAYGNFRIRLPFRWRLSYDIRNDPKWRKRVWNLRRQAKGSFLDALRYELGKSDRG